MRATFAWLLRNPLERVDVCLPTRESGCLPSPNLTANRLIAQTLGSHAEYCVSYFFCMVGVVLAGCSLVLFYGLYRVNLSFFSRLEAAVFSAGLFGFHVIAFLLSTLIL